jgi:hypothetical protein
MFNNRHTMPGSFCLIFLAVFSMLIGFGCESPFPPETLVQRLRILAVRADPPEVDLSGQVQLNALVADPTGAGRDLQCSFAVCVGQLSEMASDLDCPGKDSFPLTTDGTSAHLSLPELVQWFSQQGLVLPGTSADVTDFPLLIGVRVEAGSESARSLKRLKVRLQETGEFNRNPEIVGLQFGNSDMGGDAPVKVAGNSKVSLLPLVGADSQQSYQRPGEDTQRQEDLLFSWFSMAGEFSDQRTILTMDAQGVRLDADVWTAPIASSLVTLWVVVRDGRYGENWIERQVEVSLPQP